MGQAASIFTPLLLQRMSNSKISVPICVILLTEKEGISEWTCHILWPVAHWDGRQWQHKQHSFSKRLSDSLRKQSSSDSMKHTIISPKISWSLSKLHLWELKGKGGRTSKKIPPLCQAPDGRPSQRNASWRCFADPECCQGKGSLLGLLLLFLTEEHSWEGGKGPQRLYLGGRALWRAQNEESKGGLDFQLLVVAGSLHTDFECGLTLYWGCLWPMFFGFFLQGFYRNLRFTKCWIELWSGNTLWYEVFKRTGLHLELSWWSWFVPVCLGRNSVREWEKEGKKIERTK